MNSTSKGQVCVRSNVCLKKDAWELVPGDLCATLSPSPPRLTQRQKDEKMYYAPCCICNRTIYEINENGCDYSICRDQGINSTAEAKRRNVSLVQQ